MAQVLIELDASTSEADVDKAEGEPENGLQNATRTRVLLAALESAAVEYTNTMDECGKG